MTPSCTPVPIDSDAASSDSDGVSHLTRMAACNTCSFKLIETIQDHQHDGDDLDAMDQNTYSPPPVPAFSHCLLGSVSFATDLRHRGCAPINDPDPCHLRVHGAPVIVDVAATYDARGEASTDPVVRGLIAQGAANPLTWVEFSWSKDADHHRVHLLAGDDLGSAHARATFVRHVPAALVQAAAYILRTRMAFVLDGFPALPALPALPNKAP